MVLILCLLNNFTKIFYPLNNEKIYLIQSRGSLILINLRVFELACLQTLRIVALKN